MPQFHHRVDAKGRKHSWNADHLIDLAQALPRITVALASLHEFDEVYWFDATFPLRAGQSSSMPNGSRTSI